jgi:hypothetical protein
MWDFNTDPNSSPSKTSQSVKVDPKEIEELLAILQPKKFVIESERDFNIGSSTQAIQYKPFMSQYYGIMRAGQLKKDYEIENNIMYDVVARARYDAVYLTNVSDQYKSVLSGTMHGFHFGWSVDNNRGRIGDIFWFCDSMTYNIISDFYLNLGTIDVKWFKTNGDLIIEWVFFHYIKKNKIEIENNNWNIKLFRSSEDHVLIKDEKNGFELW